MSWFSDFVEFVAPVAAVVIDIVAPEFIPFVGEAILGSGASSAAAAAAGSAAVSSGISILGGASPEQVAKGAILGGIGGAAGSAAKGATGLTGISGAAASGAASGATQAALTGKDIGKAALKGGATAGLSAGLQSGYQSLISPSPYEITPPDSSSGLGLKGKAGAGTDLYSSTGAGADQYALKGPASTSGYEFTPSGNEASGVGIQTAGFSSDTAVPQPTTLSSSDRDIANFIAKYTVNKLSPSGSSAGSPANQPAASQTSDVAMGSQASPQAAGAADVAMLDTTSPEGISGKGGKKGGKYPWGDPEGTTALKQEGQVI
jgi:hypothetical protein